MLPYNVPAAGPSIATDLVSVTGVPQHFQRMKLSIGALGTVPTDLGFGQAAATGSLPVVIASDQVVNTTPIPATGNGLSTYRNINLLSSGVVIKASPGTIAGWYLGNRSSGEAFIKLYDKATTPGTGDIPVDTLWLPGGPTAANVAPTLPGIQFTNGISIRATTVISDADATDPTTNQVIVNIWYK